MKSNKRMQALLSTAMCAAILFSNATAVFAAEVPPLPRKEGENPLAEQSPVNLLRQPGAASSYQYGEDALYNMSNFDLLGSDVSSLDLDCQKLTDGVKSSAGSIDFDSVVNFYSNSAFNNAENGAKFSNPYLWGTSSVRTILGRQEYLGHTVLRKSVSTNFKLHKRKETDEDEQYVFQNTHEPIISQELWDSVQKRRCRVNRASAWGTHTNRLSGYLYCADCGRRLTLQTHYSKKDGSTQYSYRCGGYASRVNGCTAHSISADNVEALILASVKRFSRFVLKDEETFALELQSLWREKREEKPKQNQSELKRCQKRYDELSALIRSLYENLMAGLLPERQYKQLMAQYDSEQAELESKMETMKSEIAEDRSSSVDIQHFISLIRKCKNPTEISDSMFNELVDKIVVYEAEGAGNARTQKVDIYFNYVGQVDIAYTEEELAELKAQKEQEERQRLEKQRKREKAYREKRKAKKIAENGGEIIKTKTCPHCGKVFTPTSNRQLFCSRECWNQARLEQKKADREAEKGNHYYRQRTCAVCGHSYWPTHSQQEFCSEECRRINHNRKTLEFYHKKKGNPKPDPEAVPTPKPKEDNAA